MYVDFVYPEYEVVRNYATLHRMPCMRAPVRQRGAPL